MAYTGLIKVHTNTEEQLGVFTGYIRRPQPSLTGMLAQIFGENGPDADTILALSLTKYQDIEVFVNIYLVKDANGKIMKENGNYPLVCSFLGFVRRSLPKKDGMVAQFFAPNGIHSDSVSELSKSIYQDCLVFIDVRGSFAINKKDIIQSENQKIIDSSYSQQITKIEKEQLKDLDKKYKKINELLELDFLSKIEVLSSLGNAEEFKQWILENQPCCYQQDTQCLEETSVFEINGLLKPFNFLPLCKEHSLSLNDQAYLEKNIFYYELKQRVFLKQWAKAKLKEKFIEPLMNEPSPHKIIEWANSKNIKRLLPLKYHV